MKLHGDRVVMRPLAETDVDRIVELGSHPDVTRWWPGLTPEHVGEKACGKDEGVTCFGILVDGEVAGLIQHHEETDPDYEHAGIDLFLGAPHHGRGRRRDASPSSGPRPCRARGRGRARRGRDRCRRARSRDRSLHSAG